MANWVKIPPYTRNRFHGSCFKKGFVCKGGLLGHRATASYFSVVALKKDIIALKSQLQLLESFGLIEKKVRNKLSQASTLRDIMQASRSIIEELGLGGVAVYRYSNMSTYLWNVEREKFQGVTRYAEPNPLQSGEKAHFLRTGVERGFDRDKDTADILMIDRLKDPEKMSPEDKVQTEKDLEFDLKRYFGEDYAEVYAGRIDQLKEALKYNLYIRFPGFGHYDMIIMANNHSLNEGRIKSGKPPLPLFAHPKHQEIIFNTLSNFQKPITDELKKAEESRLNGIRIARAGATQDLQHALMTTESIEQLFEMVLDNLPDQFKRNGDSYVGTSSIMLFDTEEGSLKIRASRGLDNINTERTKVAPGEGISGKVFSNQSSWLAPDAKAELSDQEDMINAQRGAFMSVPISFEGNFYGVINVRSDHPKGFKEEDIQHLELLAGMLASKIRINNLINLDGLTDLARREHATNRINDMLEKAREHQMPLTFILADNDYFKRINDRYGHEAGDEVLKGTAQAIKDFLREHTEEYIDSIASRWGGEEWVIGLLGINEKQAQELAEELRQNLENITYTLWGEEVSVTASLGISVFPFHGKNIDTLSRKADSALYKSKAQGRNQVWLYDPEDPEMQKNEKK